MSAYKDKTQGTWYVSFRYIDWTGKKTQKLKRGFKTKKEALNYEKEFIRKTAADMKMEMNSFIQVYFEDKKIGYIKKGHNEVFFGTQPDRLTMQVKAITNTPSFKELYVKISS